MNVTSQTITWTIEDGQQSSSSSFHPRPKKFLVISFDSDEDFSTTRRALPNDVASRLKAYLAPDVHTPSTLNELRELVCKLEDECCRQKAETLLGRRDYSSFELYQKLCSYGYPQAFVESLVNRYTDVGLIDDQRYARLLIDAKKAAGWGKTKISFELKKRGIETSTLVGWPEEFFGADDEFERALSLAARKHFSGKESYPKIVRFIASKGFSYDIAKRVAHKLIDDAW